MDPAVQGPPWRAPGPTRARRRARFADHWLDSARNPLPRSNELAPDACRPRNTGFLSHHVISPPPLALYRACHRAAGCGRLPSVARAPRPRGSRPARWSLQGPTQPGSFTCATREFFLRSPLSLLARGPTRPRLRQGRGANTLSNTLSTRAHGGSCGWFRHSEN